MMRKKLSIYSWQVKFKRRSNRYTTRWDELPVVV
ncbi:MAG: DUF4113 domain-containing protein [Planctomycetes bacterium]|nr:DUF4113 domain-containing protein [Planctomycetota bacterium]